MNKGPQIKDTSSSRMRKIRKAFRLVEIKSPANYRVLLKLERILVYPSDGKYLSFYFPKENVYVCDSRLITESSLPYLASLFLHEARHVWQHRTNKKKIYKNLDLCETDAYKFQRKFLKKFGSKNELDWLDEQYKNKWWKTAKSSKKWGLRDWKRFKVFLYKHKDIFS